jgi:hypothetical protein
MIGQSNYRRLIGLTLDPQSLVCLKAVPMPGTLRREWPQSVPVIRNEVIVFILSTFLLDISFQVLPKAFYRCFEKTYQHVVMNARLANIFLYALHYSLW